MISPKFPFLTAFLSLLVSVQAIDLPNTTTFQAVPEPFALYPRDLETNLGAVNVQGEITESGIDSVVVRVSREGEAYAEKSIDLVYVEGSATFLLDFEIVAELANYRFEILGIQGGAELPIRTVNNVTAGDVYLLNGQSNAQSFALSIDGLATPSEAGPFLRSFGTNSDRAGDVGDDLGWYEASGDFAGGSGYVGQWGIRLGRVLVDTYQLPIAILSAADSGKTIDFFQRNDSDSTDLSTNYGRLLFRASQAGVADQVRAFLWWQGENDFVAPETHAPGFLALRDSWKLDYPSIEKIFLWQVRNGCSNNNVQVADIQRRLAEELDDIELMSANGVDGQDGCHYFWENGYKVLGERMAKLVARDLYGASEVENIDPPLIESAYFALQDTSRVTLVMADLDDTLTWDDGAEADFRLEGTNVRVVSGEIVGNTIKLTLDGEASASTGISYISHPEAGPWVVNGTGVGMAAFYDFPIADLPPGAPSIGGAPGQINLKGDVVSVVVSAADPNGLALAYSAAGLPAGLGINAQTGEISGTLLAEVGVYEVVVEIDNGSFRPKATFSWTITSSGSSGEPPVSDGLLLWLDANDTANLTLGGNQILEWRDKSPNQHRAGQTDIGRQPELVFNDGQPAVRFVEDTLAVPGGIIGDGTVVEDITVFVEMRHGVANELGTLFFESVGDVSESFLMQLPWSTSTHWDAGDAGDGRLAIFNYEPEITQFQTFRAESVSSSSQGQALYRNNELLGADSNAVSFTGQGRPFFLGNAGDGVYQTFDLREMLIYTRRLSAAEIAVVEAYLDLKWVEGVAVPDTTPPAVSLSSGTATTTVDTAFTVDVEFDETVTGLTSASFAVTNGSVSSVSGTGDSYVATVNPTDVGEVTVRLLAGSTADLAGNANTGSNSVIVTATEEVPPPPTPPSPPGPTSISQEGLLLWLDAAEVVTLTLDGSEVAQWADRSANAHGAVQTDSGQRPQLVNGSDGLPAIRFDGSVLTIPDGIVGDGVSHTDLVVFMVLKHGQSRELGTLFYEPFEDAFNHLSMQLPWGDAIHVDSGSDGSGRLALYEPQLQTTDFQRYRTESFSVGESFQGLYRNGELIASDEEAITFTGRGNTFYLGSAGGGNYQTFDLQELAIYSRRLGDEEIDSVESYLKQKWEDTVQVPDTTPPTVVLDTPSSTVTGAFSVDVAFDEAVTDLTGGDFTVTNAAVTTVNGGGASYTIQVTPSLVGEVTVSLPASKVSDLAGNGNVESNVLTVNYETPPDPGESPLSQDGLLLWLDAAEADQLASTGEWRDRSSNAHVAAQDDLARRPQLITAEDGLPTVQFDGSSLTIPGGIVGDANTYTDLVVFMVLRHSDSNELGTLFYEPFEDAFNHILIQMPWGGAIHFDGGSDDEGRLALYNPQLETTSFQSYRAESFTTGGQFQGLYRDGQLIAQDDTAISFRGRGNDFQLGTADGVYYQSMELRELIIYGRKPSSTETADIEAYLDAKWNSGTLAQAELGQAAIESAPTLPVNEVMKVTSEASQDGTSLILDYPHSPGAEIAIEVSTDLIHWTRDTGTFVESEEGEGTVRLRASPSSDRALYMRVVVE